MKRSQSIDDADGRPGGGVLVSGQMVMCRLDHNGRMLSGVKDDVNDYQHTEHKLFDRVNRAILRRAVIDSLFASYATAWSRSGSNCFRA